MTTVYTRQQIDQVIEPRQVIAAIQDGHIKSIDEAAAGGRSRPSGSRSSPGGVFVRQNLEHGGHGIRRDLVAGVAGWIGDWRQRVGHTQMGFVREGTEPIRAA